MSKAEEFDRLLFSVRRSVRYHDQREGFFLLVRHMADLLVIVFGVVTVILLAEAIDEDWVLDARLIIPLIGPVAVAIVLVTRVTEKGTLHQELKRDFIRLEQRMVGLRSSKKRTARLPVLVSDRLAIESREPPVLRVLDTVCHNQLVHAYEYGEEHLKKVTFVQYRLRHFFDVNPKGLHETS